MLDAPDLNEYASIYDKKAVCCWIGWNCFRDHPFPLPVGRLFLKPDPWGIAGLLIGLGCPTYQEAIPIGALYGFGLAFTFIVAGYQGSAPILTRLPFFAILGIVGAVCGIGLGVTGSFVRRKISQVS